MSTGTMSRALRSDSGALMQRAARCPGQTAPGLNGGQVPRARKVSLYQRCVGRLDGPRDGAGMTTVGDHRETHPGTQPVEDAAQPVVAQWVIPVEIGRTEDLVAVVGLVAVVVGDVGAVTGEVHEQHIAALPAADQPRDGLLDGLLRGVEVGEEGNVALLEPVLSLKQTGHVFHVGHAAAQVCPRNAVAVNADEYRPFRHDSPFTSAMGQRLRAPDTLHMRKALPVFMVNSSCAIVPV